MSDAAHQGYANHARYVPAYHFVLFAILLVNLVWSVLQLVRAPAFGTTVGALLAAGLVIIAWYLRAFATKVQDRVIRLEEALRYQRVLPPELQARAAALTVRQIVSLRFASDAELPALVQRALDEKLGGKAIKLAIKTWRPDFLRA